MSKAHSSNDLSDKRLSGRSALMNSTIGFVNKSLQIVAEVLIALFLPWLENLISEK